MIKHYVFTFLVTFFISLAAAGQNCDSPTALSAQNITGTSADLSWVMSAGASVAEISIGSAGAPIGPGIIAQVSPFVVTGLVPCTSYSFYVRSVCSQSNLSPWAGPFNFTTNGGLTCFSVSISPSLDIPTSALIAMVNGGVGPFTFQWEYNGVAIAGATGESLGISGISGVYSVIVTDSNGLTAMATFIIGANAPIANDDVFNIYPTNGNFATSSYSVLSNDIMESATISSTMTPLTVPTGFTLNANGSVSVLSGTPSGTYTLTYQLCSTFTPGLCDTATATITVVNEGILMKAFIDTNTNGTQDVGEPAFNQGQFGYELNNSGTVNYVMSMDGNYLINESNSANSYDLTYTINPGVASQYALATSSYANVSVVANSGVQVYNFPVTQIPYTDLRVSVFPYGAPPRPGFTYMNMIMYSNNGNQMIASGTVTFTNNSVVSITNISPAATTTTASGFTYDFTNLAPGEARYIYVVMQVPTIPTVALGNILTNSASITIPVGDITISNNTNVLSQVIVGSYDPNDKSEAHGGKIVYSDFTANDYLTYTIQFENTGTFSAENVSVEDNLDAKLDETSIKMTSASHGYTLSRTGNHLNWSFIGIDLPPSVANTTIGKGYITFQVKPKAGFAIGDVIPNTASIYFDFNPPIVTNTFDTEFVVNLNVAEFEKGEFTVYPNPTHDWVTISLKEGKGKIDSVQVSDVLGKIVQRKNINALVATIDLSNLTTGIYFVKVIAEGQEKVMKIVRQ